MHVYLNLPVRIAAIFWGGVYYRMRYSVVGEGVLH